MRNDLKILIAAFAIVALSAQVYAAVPSGADVSGEKDYGEFPEQGEGSITGYIESGNITNADLNANMSTYLWAGLTGNITGDIVLADKNNASMYTWSALGRMVYFSEEDTVTWGSLADASQAEVNGALGYIQAAERDNYTKTFTGGVEGIGSLIFTLINSDYAQTDSAGATTWKTYSLKDAAVPADGDDLVWAGYVEENGTDYQGKTVDYQVILPEDGSADDNAPTTYYAWVELY